MYELTSANLRTKIVLLGMALLTALSIMMVNPIKASASITTCTAWQDSTYTHSRQCATSTTGVKAIQYSDWGPNDGYCVQPFQWGSSAKNGTDWHFIGGSATETGFKDSYNYAPIDCTQTGVTTWYYTAGSQVYGSAGNIIARQVPTGGGLVGTYNTTCQSNPAAPTNPGKPVCK